MTDRLAITGLLLSTVAIGAAYASAFLPGGAPGWAAWLLAFGIPGILVAMLVLGAARGGRLGRLVYPFAALFIVVAGSFAALLALPATDPQDPVLWLGLPPRAAIVLYGVGLLPFLIVPLAYALTFDEMTLSERDMERVRERARERSRAGAEAGARDGA